MQRDFPPVFRSKRALITGGAGFVGSHLSELLLQCGMEVTVLDDLSTGRLENIATPLKHPRFSFHKGTIMDEELLESLIEPGMTVYHLASAVGVGLIVEQTLKSMETMILGTETVLRAVQRKNAKLLLASTSEVYGKNEKIPFSESDDITLGASNKNRWSYAASKLVDEFFALAYFHEKKMPVAIFRLFNTIGPRQSGQYGMVVPRFVEQALAGQDLTVYGDGEQSRCFCDVRDVVRGIVKLAKGLDEMDPEILGQVFNLGSQNRITIRELAELVTQCVRSQIGLCPSALTFNTYQQVYGNDFEDIRHRIPDLSKAKSRLNWAPRIPLDATLDAILAEKIELTGAAPRKIEMEFPLSLANTMTAS